MDSVWDHFSKWSGKRSCVSTLTLFSWGNRRNMFISVSYHHWYSSSLTHTNTLNDLNLLCTSTLDSTAPFKIRTKRGARSLPWIHKDIHSLKRQCRRAERRRKKVNLQLRHQEMKAWTTAFNEQVNEARAGYFSPLIHSNKHSPELFGAQWSVFDILQVFIRLRHRVRNVFTF